MSNRYVFIERQLREEYFSAISRDGVTGIIMPYSKLSYDNLTYAKNNGLKTRIIIDFSINSSVGSICCLSSSIYFFEAEFRYLSLDAFSEIVSKIPPKDRRLIDGFIIRYPEFSDLLWNDCLRDDFIKEYSNSIDDYLFQLFETSEKTAPLRYWYYKKCCEYVYKNHISPLIKYAKSKGFSLCIDIGAERTQYDYISKFIDIWLLIKKGVSLFLTHTQGEISETSILMSKYLRDSFVFSDKYDPVIDGLDINVVNMNITASIPKVPDDTILLITSERGMIERIIAKCNKTNSVMSNTALEASFESTYYIDKLHEKGFKFEIATESLFANGSILKNGILTYRGTDISQIIICESCIFNEKGIRLLERISNSGILINNKNLIEILGLDLIEGE